MARTTLPSSTAADPGKRPRGLTLLRDLVLIVLAGVVISFLLQTFVFRSFYIPSASMENTLQINDRVIVSLLTPEIVPLKRGDVVVFQDPGGWVGPAQNDNHLIKRIIGLPGDVVSCCDASGRLSVNGVPITEPYLLLPHGTTRADKFSFTVTVPAHSLWVMGDNRYYSGDSAYRYFEHLGNYFVPEKDVVGRAMVISWPLGRWRYLDDYPNVFKKIGSPHQ